MPEESRDTRRGIQNVQQRVSNIPSRETVGERHLRGGKWGNEEKRVREEEKIAKTQEQEIAIANAVMIAEAEESTNQSRIQHALRKKGEEMLLKKVLGKKTLLARSSIRATLWFALTAYAFQILFAIGAMIGFGSQAIAMVLAEETIIGKAFDFIIGVDNLPFEYIGYGFLGLGILLSLIVLLGYLLFFRFIGVSILQSSTMLLITVVCFTLNITPFINILPWLLMWVIYMSLFSSSE